MEDLKGMSVEELEALKKAISKEIDSRPYECRKSDIMWEKTLKQLNEGKSIVDFVRGEEIGVLPVEVEYLDNHINLTFKVSTDKGYIWRTVEIKRFSTLENSDELGEEGESLLTDVQRLRVVESCGYFIDGIGHILGNSKTILEKVLS